MNLKHQKTKRIELKISKKKKKKRFNKLQQTTRTAQKDIKKQQKLFERYQRKKISRKHQETIFQF
jgi:hypothetical protein